MRKLVALCSETKLALCSETKLALCSETKLALCSETKLALCSETKLALCSETKLALCSETKLALCSETKLVLVQLEYLEGQEDQGHAFKVGKLNLVDLAGSERVRLTGATGRRLEEVSTCSPLCTQILLSCSCLV